MKNRAEELVGKMSPLVEPSEDWHEVGSSGEPVFENGWINYSSAYNSAGFYKSMGRVYLKGLIKTGSVGNTAFTLPEGYRPEYENLFSVLSNGAAGRVDIFADGTVKPITPSNNTWVQLDGISFRVD